MKIVEKKSSRRLGQVMSKLLAKKKKKKKLFGRK